MKEFLKIRALENHKFISASCGDRHSCGLTTKGEIYTWGKVDFCKDHFEVDVNSKIRKEVAENSKTKF